MNIGKILGGCFAIMFGAYYVYKAFTARQFENIGEGLNPPEEQRYVTATLGMRIAVGIFALGFILMGVWLLIKATR